MGTQLRSSEAMRRTGNAAWLTHVGPVALEDLIAPTGAAAGVNGAVVGVVGGAGVTIVASGRF